MALSPHRLTIYLYSAHRAVIFAIAQLSCLMVIFVLYNYLSHCYSIAWDRLYDRWRLSVCLSVCVSVIAPIVTIFE